MRGLHRAYMNGLWVYTCGLFCVRTVETLADAVFRAIWRLLRCLSGRCLRSVRVAFECRFMAAGIGEG